MSVRPNQPPPMNLLRSPGDEGDETKNDSGGAIGWTSRMADTGSHTVTGTLAMGHVLVLGAASVASPRIRNLLESEGFEVSEFALPTIEALRTLDAGPVDLAIILLHGDDASRGIDIGKELLKQRTVPLLLLADDVSPATLRRARELAPDGYLSMPVEDRTLVAMCVAALRRQRTSQLARWMQEALDSSDEAMAVVDRLATEDALRMTNASFRHQFGTLHVQSGAELVGSIIAPEDVRRGEIVTKAVAQGTELRIHVHCALEGGQRFAATLWVRPIRDWEGYCRYVLLVIQDITRELDFDDARRLRASLQPLLAEAETLMTLIASTHAPHGHAPSVPDPAFVLAAQRLRQRVRFLGETSPMEPPSDGFVELSAYLDERFDRLAEWFDAPLTISPGVSPFGTWVDTTTVTLDRILFGVAMGIRGSSPGSVTMSLHPGSQRRIGIHIERHGPVDNPEQLAWRARKQSTGRARGTLHPLHAARRSIGLIGGTLELLDVSEQRVSLVLEFPSSRTGTTGAPRVATAETLFNSNARSRILLALADFSTRQQLASLLREHLFDVVVVSSTETLIRQMGESSEAFDLLICDSNLLADLEDPARSHAPLHLLSTWVIVIGQPEAVPRPSSIADCWLVPPLEDATVLREVVTLLESPQRDSTPPLDASQNAIMSSNEVFPEPLTEQESIEMARVEAPALLREFLEALGTLHVHYQPLVRASDATIVAYEALMRPNHGQLRHPGLMLDAAERLGLISMLGRVIRQRIADDCCNLSGSKVQIFVNLHPKELTATLCQADDPLRPHASRIVYEITERARLTSIPNLDTVLEELRSHGFRFAVDDLGEGYSGLVSLQRLRPEVVKIDMSLVRGIHRSPFKRDLLKTLQVFFRAQHYQTVAEGVETLEEANTLSGIGIMLLQGFYFAKPGPPWPQV